MLLSKINKKSVEAKAGVTKSLTFYPLSVTPSSRQTRGRIFSQAGNELGASSFPARNKLSMLFPYTSFPAGNELVFKLTKNTASVCLNLTFLFHIHGIQGSVLASSEWQIQISTFFLNFKVQSLKFKNVVLVSINLKIISNFVIFQFLQQRIGKFFFTNVFISTNEFFSSLLMIPFREQLTWRHQRTPF